MKKTLMATLIRHQILVVGLLMTMIHRLHRQATMTILYWMHRILLMTRKLLMKMMLLLHNGREIRILLQHWYYLF